MSVAGTANVFCAAEPKAGRHFTFSNTQSFGLEFAQVVFNSALEYPKAKTIHLVMDKPQHPWLEVPVRCLRHSNGRPPKSETDSRSSTRLLMEAGSIKQRSKSGPRPAMFGKPENARSEDLASGSEGMESADES